jgi:hypothetical protein
MNQTVNGDWRTAEGSPGRFKFVSLVRSIRYDASLRGKGKGGQKGERV